MRPDEEIVTQRTEAICAEEQRARRMVSGLEEILTANPTADRDNVWHTLILLEEPAIDRLNRGLLRGRAAPLH